ncbi:MAG: preprotein translocase subunit SecG [Pseudomonadota bacterium]
MNTFESVLLMLLVLDALALIVLVMLQQGKGADVGAAFGAGASNTMFGAGGSASFLTKLTVWLAIGFFAISFGLAYFAQVRADQLDTLGIPSAQSGVPAAVEEVGTLDAAGNAAAEAASEAGAAVTDDADLEAAVDAAADAAAELTPDAESVDSDIPEV